MASLSSPGALAASAKEPALAPPPGVVPNFINPYNQGPVLLVIGSILMALMVILVAIRAYTKLFIQRKLSWDDLTCGLGVVGTTAYFICSVIVVKGGKVGIHQWNVSVLDLTSNNYVVGSYLIDVLVSPVLLVIKLTFFLLYLQIFRPDMILKYCIYGGALFTTLAYASMGTAQFVFLSPRPGETFLEDYLKSVSSNTLLDSVDIGLPLSACGIAIDLYILLLPIAAVSKLQMAPRKRLGVMAIFATGLIAVLASILSLYFRVIMKKNIIQNSSNSTVGLNGDFTWYLLPVITLALIEMIVGVMCSCMPQLSSFTHHHISLIRSLRSKVHEASPFKGFSRIGTPPEKNDNYLESNILGTAKGGEGKFLATADFQQQSAWASRGTIHGNDTESQDLSTFRNTLD